MRNKGAVSRGLALTELSLRDADGCAWYDLLEELPWSFRENISGIGAYLSQPLTDYL